MELLKPWYALDIDVSNAIRKDFNFDKLLKEKNFVAPAPIHMWQYHVDNIDQLYSADWIKYMQDINLPISGTLIFWRQAHYIHPTIHIDIPHGATGKLGMALNWCLGPDNANMVWYKTPETPATFDVTETKSKYHYWPIEHGVECARRCIGSTPTLVRVDIPHNVIMNDLPRVLISCRINVQPEGWNQAVEYVKSWIIE